MPFEVVLAAGEGFGPHLGGLGDILGMGWVPDWPGDRTMGLIALSHGREHCFTRSQGSKIPSKWRVDLMLLGPSINLTTA